MSINIDELSEAVMQNNKDLTSENMIEIDRGIWEQVAKAKSHKNVNWFIWDNVERVITKYCKLAR